MNPTPEPKRLIVCAISRSYSSRYSQERAIALAKERGSKVAFVNVVDARPFQELDTPELDTVIDELKRVCTSLLSIAVERADAQGVDATMVVLEGKVTEALENYLRSSQAETLVIGAAGNILHESIFMDEQQRQFVEHLRAELGIEVIVVDEHRRNKPAEH
jgi:nucleotide-binding universal stress UspA family protein